MAESRDTVKLNIVRGKVAVVRQLMEREGVTPTALAQTLNVSTSYVSQALNESSPRATAETLETFANSMGYSLFSEKPRKLSPLGKGKLEPRKGGKKT